MNFALNLVLVLQIVSALAMVGLILMQHGKGADMGAAFGSGSAGSLFGSSGSANFLSRTTAVLATVFLVSTLTLAYFGFSIRAEPDGGSVLDRAAAVAPAGTASPAQPAGAAASIPTGAAPADGAALAPASAPAAAATGAAQIPQ
ncbi:MAG: preprotein translocase subunit SecG [Pseudomonadota bacterium]|nr:preprotein translocase subunit SecG [Pseudomonadota bacterium]